MTGYRYKVNQLITETHGCFYGAAFFPFRCTVRADGVVAHRCGNYESLGIMHHKRLKLPRGTFNHSLVALHKIENVDSASGIERDRFGEPVAPRLYKFVFMKAGAFLAPSVTL